MTQAPQSSPPSSPLPAPLRRLAACLALALAASPAAAQQVRPLRAEAVLLKEPTGVELATLARGERVRAGAARNGWVEVTVEGWVFGASLERTTRDGFDLVVRPAQGENLRREPNGAIAARLRTGALLARVETRGAWVRVRRSGWIPQSAIEAPAPAAPASAPPADSTAETPADAADVVQVATGATLYAVPDGGAFGQLQGGARGRILGRSGEWVRVQLDGWVRAGDLTGAAEGILVGVTAAEVRAAPERFVGKVVEWRIQAISVQTADELRPEMTPGQLYVLSRGPLPEPGFVYVTVTRQQADEFRALPPLAEVTIRATVRAARSRYLATPVVEYLGRVDPGAR